MENRWKIKDKDDYILEYKQDNKPDIDRTVVVEGIVRLPYGQRGRVNPSVKCEF